MNANLKFKIGFLLFFTSLFLFCAVLFYDFKHSSKAKLDQISETVNETSTTFFVNEQEKVKGQNLSVKFEKDLETSLKIQETPKIWFEFNDENKSMKTVEVPKQTEEYIQKRWTKTLEYSFASQLTKSRNEKIDINKNYLNDAAVLAQKLTKIQIITSSEKRNLSEKEAFAVMNVVAKLAIERYEELQNMASQIKPQKISK